MITDVLLPEPAREELRRRWPHYLVVVPDGALHQLPLESLRLAGDPPRYLLDEMPPITYAPSAMILAALAQRPKADRRRHARRFVAFDRRQSALS